MMTSPSDGASQIPDATVTISDWLDGREHQPPDALAARIRASLGAATASGAESLAPRFIELAEAIARRVVDHGGSDRSDASDLLLADALVTYAFEYAAESRLGSVELAELAARTMEGLSSIVEPRR
jgi:hypothetical protein